MHPDSEDVVGEIGVDEAIQAFNDFPWSQQLEEAENREMNSTLPTMYLKCEDGRKLGIWTSNLENFELYYCNSSRESYFTLSRDVTRNIEGLFVEDFIAWFYSGEIENKLKLSRKEKTRKSRFDLNFQFNMRSHLSFFIPVGIWLPLHLGIMQIDFGSVTSNIFTNTVAGVCWIFPIALYVQYYIINHKASLTTSANKKSLVYKDPEKTIEFNPVDIKYCEYVKTRSFLAPWSLNKYIRLVLKDDRNIILTCLLGEVEEFLTETRVLYKKSRPIVPLILTRKKY